MRPLGGNPSFNTYKYKPKTDIDKLRSEKREFLKEFSSKYGYNGRIDYIREEEYPQLKSEIYLDHTGATTFPRSSVVNFNQDILNNLYGNPHSNSSSSQASSMRIEGVRKRILRHFNTNEDDYTVIFTQNATAAIKMVGEMFPWTEKSTYKNLRESHNSINGLRRFLEAINPDNIRGVTEDEVKELISRGTPFGGEDDDCRYDSKYGNDDEITYHLFAYPAQCNFSGMRFPLNWVSKIKKLNTRKSKTLVLLDAAAFVPSAQLSLANKDASPDFVCLSFYKMFGYPTGLGALIVKSELNPILRKGFFGGGTINSVVYDKNWQKFSKELTVRYEDGTVNFLNIIALDHAFDSFERLYGNIKNVSNHVTSLNSYLSRNMRALRHWNGQSVISVNSDRDFFDSRKQGGIFSFNVRSSDGTLVGYLELEKLASTHGIHIRSGGNCNPGSIARWNEISAEEVIQNYDEGKWCSDDKDIYKGKSYGGVRVSIGAMTTIEDVLIWIDFFKRHYVEIMPGKTVHNMSSSRLLKYSKLLFKNSRSTDDLRRASRLIRDTDSDSSGERSSILLPEDLRVSRTENFRASRLLPEDLRVSRTENFRASRLLPEDLRASDSDIDSTEDLRASKPLGDRASTDDLRKSLRRAPTDDLRKSIRRAPTDDSGKSLKKRASISDLRVSRSLRKKTSIDDLKVSKLSKNKDSTEDFRASRLVKNRAPSEDMMTASKLLKYAKASENLKAPKLYNDNDEYSSPKRKYNTYSHHDDNRRTLRNVKNLYIVTQ